MDPACSAVAASRSGDAAVNGYDKQVQQSVWQDTYKNCMVWGTKSVLVDKGHR